MWSKEKDKEKRIKMILEIIASMFLEDVSYKM